jgi:hypothetical protein
VRLEASTKTHAHKKIHKFFIHMAFTMAYPNFKKGLKMASGPLGINNVNKLYSIKQNLGAKTHKKYCPVGILDR